jgi:hypothetical protein
LGKGEQAVGSSRAANSHRFKPLAKKIIEKKCVFSTKIIVVYGRLYVETYQGS